MSLDHIGGQTARKIVKSISADVIRLHRLMSDIKPIVIGKDQEISLKKP